MTPDAKLRAFAVATPGLEAPLLAEVQHLGLPKAQLVKGGVEFSGDWPDVWRANLVLRGATRILVRIAEFRAVHPAQLDKRARKVPWADVVTDKSTIRVEAVCRKSRIYHAGAAQTRVEKAVTDATGATPAKEADVVIKVRIEDDLCTISVDTSGASLHKRGHKLAVNKAPMRETLAAMFLAECDFHGQIPVYDPMCGSGTFVIEAAEMATNLVAGRHRHFAFEQLCTFDAKQFDQLRASEPRDIAPTLRFFGSDRDAGAVKMAAENAERAGVADICHFACHPISDITPPTDVPGLVVVNPPYGGRIGKKGPLYGLYAAFGEAMRNGFKGWRVAMVTTSHDLAKATGLPFKPPGPIVAHGGLKIRLWQTDPL